MKLEQPLKLTFVSTLHESLCDQNYISLKAKYYDLLKRNELLDLENRKLRNKQVILLKKYDEMEQNISKLQKAMESLNE